MLNLISGLREIIVYVFLITGTYLLICTAIGVLRFPDFYTRLHTVSKCLIVGSVSILAGCIVRGGISYTSLQIIIIIIFLLITNPVAMHVIAGFAYHNTKTKNIGRNDLEQ